MLRRKFFGSYARKFVPPGTWTSGTLPQAILVKQGSAYGNGTHVLMDYNTSAVLTSPDAATWTKYTGALTTVVKTIYAASLGLFIAVQGTHLANSSDNGQTWSLCTLPTLPANYIITDIAWNGSAGVAILHNSISPYLSNQYLYSTDGVNWSLATVPLSASWGRLACNTAGLFVLLVGFGQNTNQGTASANVLISSDGVSWTTGTNIPSALWAALTFNGNVFFAAQNNSTAAVTSVDGVNWTGVTLPISAPVADAKSSASGTILLCASTSSNVYVSTDDGQSFSATAVTFSSGNPSTAHYGGGKYVLTSTVSTANVLTTTG